MSATSHSRSIARLSGKTTSSWNLVHHDQLQICKGLKWQHPAAAAAAAAIVLSSNMQRYNNPTTNMTFDDTPSYFGNHESFGMVDTAEQQAQDGHPAGRNSNNNSNNNNSMTSYTVGGGSSLDPSAGFPGLGELPSSGMDQSCVGEHGSFTGDLNASAYDVGEDHSQLLQDMLQQQQQQSQTNQTGHSPQASTQGGGASSASAWEDSLHVLQEMLLLQQQQQAQQIYQSQAEQVFSHAFSSSTAPSHVNHHHHHATTTTAYNNNNNNRSSTTMFPGESELLSLLQLPRTLSLPSSGFSPLSSHRGKSPLYSTSSIAGPVNTGEFFESRLGLSHGSLHHGASHTAASFFHTLPRGDHGTSSNSLASSLLTRPSPILLDLDQQDRGDADDGKAGTSPLPFGLKRDQQQGLAAGLGKGEPRGVNHFATERQRREFLNEKYQTLRALVPNPTKADRASIVADAIDYVKELKRTVQELQQLVQEKRRAAGNVLGGPNGRKRSHRCMAQNAEGGTDVTTGTIGAEGSSAGGSTWMQQKGSDGLGGLAGDGGSQLRSSWLQRTSQNGTHVDVRIVHDEVTIKLTQRRHHRHHHSHGHGSGSSNSSSNSSSNCLLEVFVVLQELRLDLLQASGASIGEHDVFLFNSKILEGSSTFAGYIAAKMLDAVDPHPLL